MATPTTTNSLPPADATSASARRRTPLGLKIFAALWVVVPVVAMGYHFGYSDPHQKRDTAGELIAQGDKASAQAETLRGRARLPHDLLAAARYASARSQLPLSDVEDRISLRLRELHHRIEAGELIEAQVALQQMLDDHESTAEKPVVARQEVSDQPSAKTAAEALASRSDEVRALLARVTYYVAFALRKEGVPEQDWRAEADASRQQYRHLVEVAGGSLKELHASDLETVVRFARLPDSMFEQQGEPSACENAGQISKKKGKQKFSKSKAPNPSDAREQINSDAASDAMQRGKGS